MNPGKHLGIRAAEGVGIQKQAEQHDIHGEKAAYTEPDQQPGGLPLLGFAALDLVGNAAAVAAECASLTVHCALHCPPPDG
jgi:hypothetical protein